jgi:hypothetical protein
MLRVGHIQDGEGKKKEVKVNMVDVFSIYKNEYRIFRKGLK